MFNDIYIVLIKFFHNKLRKKYAARNETFKQILSMIGWIAANNNVFTFLVLLLA